MRDNKDLEGYLTRAQLDQMDRWIREAQTVALAAHLHLDGDACGSVLGLGQVLEDMGKQVDRLAFEDLGRWSYLEGVDRFTGIQEDKHYDLFILLDLGDLPRMGEAKTAFDQSQHQLCFDHHRTNEEVCELNLVIPNASSTCEVLTLFCQDYGYPISPQAATALFNGIITDSNRFLYDADRPRTLRAAAHLIEAGAQVDRVYGHEYNNQNPALLAFQGHVIETTEFFQGGQLALFPLRQQEVAQYGLSMAAAEGTVDTVRSLQGVELACQVREEGPEACKLSFRSKDYYNVAELAQSFGGGGHRKAAGASLTGSVDQVMAQMRTLLQGLDLEAGRPVPAAKASPAAEPAPADPGQTPSAADQSAPAAGQKAKADFHG